MGQKNLVQLFNTVARRIGRPNQRITDDDLRNEDLNQSQMHILDAINDEIEIILSEHKWINTTVLRANFETASKPSAPQTNSISGNNPSGKSERTLYVKITLNWPHGETLTSDTVEQTVSNDEWLEVVGPSLSKRATSWNVYIGDTSGNEILQQKDIEFGTDFNEETDGPLNLSGTENQPVRNVDMYSLRGKKFAGQNRPPDHRFINAVTIPSENRELYFLTPDEWTTKELHSETPSIPQYYRIVGVDQRQDPIIQFWPSPDTQYTINYDYNERFCRLENPEDHCPIDDQIVIWGTTMSMLDFDAQNYDLAANRYQRIANRIEKRNKPTKDDIQYGGGRDRSGKNSRPDFPKNIPNPE